MSERPRIGWVGSGVMGAAMCGHVLDAGYRVTVYTRTKPKAQGLIDREAVWAESPAEVAAASDISCIIVGCPRMSARCFSAPQGCWRPLPRGMWLWI